MKSDPLPSSARTVPPKKEGKNEESSDEIATGTGTRATATQAMAPPTPGSMPEQLPATLGRYQLVKLLGKGGMGSVYLALDSQLDREVALKIPQFTPGTNASTMERFFREARAAATLQHANICPVFDVGEINGLHYLTMAFIEGRSLSAHIRAAAKPLPLRQVAVLVRKLALALEEAHRKKVIHRDLKPANIMVNRRGEPIIMDFGLARRGSTQEARLTQAGSIMGTPAYMAPEQAKGDLDEMGPGCDIYSLGVILYELMTGRLPFTGDTLAILSQVLVDEPKPPSTHRADIDSRLEGICLKAMAKKLDVRYQSMADFAAALTDYLKSTAQSGTEGVTARAPFPELPFAEVPSRTEIKAPLVQKSVKTTPPPPGGRRWIGAALTFMAAVGLLVAGAVMFLSTDKGTIAIALSDPKADVEIKVDGETVHLAHDDRSLQLSTGTHRLEVTGKGYEKSNKDFVVARGTNSPVRVTLVPVAPVKPSAAAIGKGPVDKGPGPAPIKAAAVVTIWPAELVKDGKIVAPDLSKLEPRTFRDFTKPTAGLKNDPNKGRENGVFYIKNGIWNEWTGNKVKNLAVEAVGRVAGGSGSWGLFIVRTEKEEKSDASVGGGISIRISTSGTFRVSPARWNQNEDPKVDLPFTRHPAINEGDKYNTLLAIVRGRMVEIYVNQRAVCEPILLDRDITPPVVQLGHMTRSPTTVRAEFRQLTVWPQIESVPPPDKRVVILSREADSPYAWPADALKDGKILAPKLSKVTPWFEDRFTDAKSGFPVGTDKAYQNGKYHLMMNAPMRKLVAALVPLQRAKPPNPSGDFACEVKGGAMGAGARWGVSIASGTESGTPVRAMITLGNPGILYLGSGLDETDLKRLEPDPGKHPAIRKGGRPDNTMLVTVRGRHLEVFVNGVAVCDPVLLDRPIASPQISLVGVGAAPKKPQNITFERITVWPATGIPTLDQRGAAPRKTPVKPQGGGVGGAQ